MELLASNNNEALFRLTSLLAVSSPTVCASLLRSHPSDPTQPVCGGHAFPIHQHHLKFLIGLRFSGIILARGWIISLLDGGLALHGASDTTRLLCLRQPSPMQTRRLAAQWTKLSLALSSFLHSPPRYYFHGE